MVAVKHEPGAPVKRNSSAVSDRDLKYLLIIEYNLCLVDEEKKAADRAEWRARKANRARVIVDSDNEEVEQNMEPAVCSYLPSSPAAQLISPQFTSRVVPSKPTAVKDKAQASIKTAGYIPSTAPKQLVERVSKVPRTPVIFRSVENFEFDNVSHVVCYHN